MVVLGAYELGGLAGEGAMATVYQATHRRDHLRVAVKVLRGEWAREPWFRAYFANEVRVMAALDHPHIARVYDHGEVTADEAARSEGRLEAGSPYLVIEWASGGFVRLRQSVNSWSELRALLRALLDALAHAHARGVVHRDLKPSNVMLCTRDDLRPGIKLVDFGIAHLLATDRALDGEKLVGTPRFMAPEQVVGDFRDLGPWTDLYALGCIAFAAASGFSPFSGAAHDVLAAHVDAPIPVLRPQFDVPVGLREWVERLLEKRPQHRFRRAADAAYALSLLDASARPPNALIDASSDVDAAPTEIDAQPRTAVVPRRGGALDAVADAGLAVRVALVPPMSGSWRGDEIDASPRGRGLPGPSLQGIRPPPLAGREEERDRLWAALRRVVEERRPGVIVLRGATGLGKSRLAEWLCQRADELGAATALRVAHGPTPGPSQGLAAALVRHYRLGGLARAALAARLSELLAARDSFGHRRAVALAQIAVPPREGERDAVVFSSAAERHALMRGLLEEIAEERPLVVSIDDARWGDETIAFVRHALESWQHAPRAVLFVVAQRVGAPALPIDVETVDLGPLGAADHARWVHEQLGLERELAARVAARTAGNPLFTVHLVQDWIARERVVPGDQGLASAENALLVPDEVSELLAARVALAYLRAPDDELRALEIAAALGLHVEAREWADACEAASISFPTTLLAALLGEGLLRAEDRGASYQFAHEEVRATFEREARVRRRYTDAERACARMLATRSGADARLRRARHLASAGEIDASLEPFAAAASELLHRGELAQTHAVLDEHEHALARAGLPPGDERRAAGRALRMMAFAREGRFTEGEPLAISLEAEAVAHGWTRTRLMVMSRLTQLHRVRGDFASAQAVALAAEELATKAGERRLRGDARSVHGDLHMRTGSNERAIELYLRAIDDFAAEGLEFDVARCETGLGAAARAQGRTDDAIAHLERARSRFDRVGSRWGVAKASNALADSLRDRGDPARAEPMYREALAHLDALGAQEARFVELNLAILALQRRETDVARDLLARCEAATRHRGGESVILLVVVLGLLAAEAIDGQWKALDALVEPARSQLATGRYVDPDLATLLAIAAEAAAEAGQSARAASLCRLAAQEWRKLGRTPRADALELQAAALDAAASLVG